MNLRKLISKNKKLIITIAFIVLLNLGLFTLPFNDFTINMNEQSEELSTPIDHENSHSIRSSEYDYKSIDAISNGNFSQGYAHWQNETSGDDSDINSSISGGHANYEIMGESHVKKIDDPIDIAHSSSWVAFNKSEPAINPDTCEIDDEGFHVSHSWHDDASDQVATITWRYNVSMDGIDMSEYNITSAFLNATMYANVNWNIDTQYDSDAGRGSDTLDQRGIYDHAIFYIEISDLNLNNYYRVAYNQTNDLGRDDTGFYTINEKTIESQGTEQDLIYYLTQVLNKDPEHDNFTIIVGMEVHCEDNYQWQDYDDWTELRILSLNLTFTYEKIINEFSSESWNQQGTKIEGADKSIINATLNFEYRINETWWDATKSPNSEFRIYINGYKLIQTVKLNDSKLDWQKFDSQGVDVTPFVDVDEFINLSIQVFIADEFSLDHRINISIDNVSLIVWYSVYTAPIDTKYDLLLNGINKTLPLEIEVGIGDPLNITFIYTNLTGDFIDGATVTLKGAGLDTTLDPHPQFNQYNRTIDTGPLGFGDKYLTIRAYRRYYEVIEKTFRVRVSNRNASIEKVYLNGTEQTSISLGSGDPLNITVNYIDQSTTTFIDNATVKLWEGTNFLGNLNNKSGFNQYNITLDTSILSEGVSYLSISAEKENYTIDSATITVVIYAKSTDKMIYLNGTQTTYIACTVNKTIK